MKINIENMINQARSCIKKDPGGYKYCLKELLNNLKEVKIEHDKGNSKEVLNEFFNLYIFNREG